MSRRSTISNERWWCGAVAVAIAIAMGSGAAAAAGAPAAATESAVATMLDAKDKPVGQVTLQQTPSGVLITGDLRGLPPGVHAIHLHAKGECKPPFESAGPHFNPTGRRHGIKNPAGAHAGDLPNVTVDKTGEARFEILTAAVTLTAGAASVFDADGTSVVVHASADDYATDPAGNAGARIACGVIRKR